MSREAMKQVLEALESDPISHAGLVSIKQAITALRQALETEQDPVYWSVAIDELRQALEAKREHGLQEALEDGWCAWEFHSPFESSVFSCDCGLVHEVDIRVVRYESLDSEVYEVVDDHNLEAQMRLRRRDDLSTEFIIEQVLEHMSDSYDDYEAKPS